jgi:hypothetical protein
VPRSAVPNVGFPRSRVAGNYCSNALQVPILFRPLLSILSEYVYIDMITVARMPPSNHTCDDVIMRM